MDLEARDANKLDDLHGEAPALCPLSRNRHIVDSAVEVLKIMSHFVTCLVEKFLILSRVIL